MVMEKLIEKAYKEFGVNVSVVDKHQGPSLTTYEVKLAMGTMIKELSKLEQDIAMKIRAKSIRYQIPFQNTSHIGIEVPNEDREMISFDDLESSSGLDIPIGKDTVGNDVSMNIAKLPHLLVAGQTGSGKSVALNCIISSLIKNNTKEDVRLVLVDPKRVEFTPYQDAEHVIDRVIDEVEDTITVLEWLCEVMDKRYDLLSKHKARNIDSLASKGIKIPRIVVVIDELADLMSQNKKRVEAPLVRLAQKARAAGIHLILATQRPSVNVITGILKANIPARMAFRVASGTDSSVILDQRGAENLLGAGDMLYTSPENGDTQRIQGAYMSDEDVELIVETYGKKSPVRTFLKNLLTKSK